jgi:hypothetical protein
VPSAAQLAGLIPDFLDLWVELDDDGILEECARAGLLCENFKPEIEHLIMGNRYSLPK